MQVILEDRDEEKCSAFEYVDVKAKAKNTDKSVKTEYTIKKDEAEYKDDSEIARGMVSFQHLQCKGMSTSIKKINSMIKKESSKFLKSETSKRLKDYMLSIMEDN